jgi:diguanylate cyclase (GGDEF)-like protein
MNAHEFDSRLQILRREAFDRDLADRVDSALLSGDPVALVILDLDKFKLINDQHGHPVGDEVLESVSGLVRRLVGAKGTCYRYGGEELSILLSNYTTDEAVALAERIRGELERLPISGKQLRITASFGVAELPVHAQSATDLLRKADEALYQAKNLGRNRVRIFGEPIPARVDPKPPARRQPEPSDLSDQEAEIIRRDYFRNGSAECPKDGGRLTVRSLHTHNRRTPDPLVSCPLCGLAATLRGPA